MSVLTVAKDVAKVIGVAVPDTVASNTSREIVELFSTMCEMALRISRGHYWRSLAKIDTMTGDGSLTAFDLPSDYDRQLVKSQLWASSLQTPLSPISSLDEWLGLEVQSFDFVLNAWIIYGDQVHVKPALANAATAKYFYQSNLIAKASDDMLKAAFTADDDVFRLDEQLLTHAVIWRWKENKGQPYAENMADYEELKERLVSRDKGSRKILLGKVRMPYDATTAYPVNVPLS